MHMVEVNGVKRECSFLRNDTSPSIEVVARSQRASTVTVISPIFNILKHFNFFLGAFLILLFAF